MFCFRLHCNVICSFVLWFKKSLERKKFFMKQNARCSVNAWFGVGRTLVWAVSSRRGQGCGKGDTPSRRRGLGMKMCRHLGKFRIAISPEQVLPFLPALFAQTIVQHATSQSVMSRTTRLNKALTAALYNECNTTTNRNTSDEQDTKYDNITDTRNDLLSGHPIHFMVGSRVGFSGSGVPYRGGSPTAVQAWWPCRMWEPSTSRPILV